MNTLDCERARGFLADMLVNDIDAEDLESLEAHVARCAPCARLARESVFVDLAMSEMAAQANLKELTGRLRHGLTGSQTEKGATERQAPELRKDPLDGGSPSRSSGRSARSSGPRVRYLMGGLAASALVGLGIFLLARPSPKADGVVARVERTQGEVYLIKGDLRNPAVAGAGMVRDQRLVTIGRTASALLRFSDGTSLEAAGETEIGGLTEASEGKRVFLARGQLRADVSPQPNGAPAVIRTPHAEATVMGTSLIIHVDPGVAASTRLDVENGKVRLTRLSDRAGVDVISGHFAVAGAGTDLVARKRSDLFWKAESRNGWSVSFEQDPGSFSFRGKQSSTAAADVVVTSVDSWNLADSLTISFLWEVEERNREFVLGVGILPPAALDGSESPSVQLRIFDHGVIVGTADTLKRTWVGQGKNLAFPARVTIRLTPERLEFTVGDSSWSGSHGLPAAPVKVQLTVGSKHRATGEYVGVVRDLTVTQGR